MLTREARDAPSNADLLTQLQSLEGEVARASERVRDLARPPSASRADPLLTPAPQESRVAQNLERVRALEAGPAAAFGGAEAASVPAAAAALAAAAAALPRKGLSPRFCDASSLDSPAASSRLAHFWHPVQFLSKLRDGEELWAFGCRWTLRAAPDAPLGWRVLDERARPLPVRVVDGMLAVWPGEQPPPAGEAGGVQAPGRLSPPPGYAVHAEIVVEDVPVEHGLLLENLLDLAHAPFTHTGTFAKGWSVPAAVHFGAAQQHGWAGLGSWLAAASGGGSRGSWNPYPIDMAFEPPCCAVSHIGLAQAGAAGSGASFVPGSRAADCPKHLHQLHVCIPSRPGRTRLLYRMALDFASWAQLVPGMHLVWSEMAAQVLGEDLRLVEGQQARLGAGSRVWAHPVAYDACALAYRRFRNAAALPYDAQAEEEGAGREAEQDGVLSQ